MMQFHKKIGGATKGGGGAWTLPRPPNLGSNNRWAPASPNLGGGQGARGPPPKQ
jgi:hypothetical protein